MATILLLTEIIVKSGVKSWLVPWKSTAKLGLNRTNRAIAGKAVARLRDRLTQGKKAPMSFVAAEF